MMEAALTPPGRSAAGQTEQVFNGRYVQQNRLQCFVGACCKLTNKLRRDLKGEPKRTSAQQSIHSMT